MVVSKVNEIIGSSSESFEAAARHVVERANRTLRGLREIEVLGKEVAVSQGRVAEYRLRVRLHFDMAPETFWHW